MLNAASPEAGTVYNPFLYNGTDAQLEKFLLTGLVVAGKTAAQQEPKLEQFLALLARDHVSNYPLTPLMLLEMPSVEYIRLRLEQVKMGQYTRISQTMKKLSDDAYARPVKLLDLRTCTRDDLIKYPGIGMKTASFFLLFTRPGIRIACLDTHILCYLRDKKLADAPKVTPGTKKQYEELERVFLAHCDDLNRVPAELDFEIWELRNRGNKNARNNSGT